MILKQKKKVDTNVTRQRQGQHTAHSTESTRLRKKGVGVPAFMQVAMVLNSDTLSRAWARSPSPQAGSK